jgi:hypothetical protein
MSKSIFLFWVSIPESNLILQFYRGARAAVLENFKDNPLFDISTEHPTTYYEDMQRAVFCLCPLGWEPWSPRLVEAVIFGCISVVIADDIVLPFADAIPWEEIGVFIAEKDVLDLDTILTSIPLDVILRKQRLLANPSMKQAMLFPQPAQPGDAFQFPSSSEWISTKVAAQQEYLLEAG